MTLSDPSLDPTPAEAAAAGANEAPRDNVPDPVDTPMPEAAELTAPRTRRPETRASTRNMKATTAISLRKTFVRQQVTQPVRPSPSPIPKGNRRSGTRPPAQVVTESGITMDLPVEQRRQARRGPLVDRGPFQSDLPQEEDEGHISLQEALAQVPVQSRNRSRRDSESDDDLSAEANLFVDALESSEPDDDQDSQGSE